MNLARLFPTGPNVDCSIITGLPTDESGILNIQKKIAAAFKPTTEPYTHTFRQNGKKRKITVHGVIVLPQPVGTLFAMLLTNSGKGNSANAYLLKDKNGIIEIGAGTTDLNGFDGVRQLDALKKIARHKRAQELFKKAFPHIIFLEEAQVANVLGYYRYGQKEKASING